MRAGIITIFGKPNSGKSTLFNSILNEKLSIISPKPQTTWHKIRGVLNVEIFGTSEVAQLVFIDTPGFHKKDGKLNKYLNEAALSSLDGVDIVYYLIVPFETIDGEHQKCFEELKKNQSKNFLVVNKIDTVSSGFLNELEKLYEGEKKEAISQHLNSDKNFLKLKSLIDEFLNSGLFSKVFFISSLKDLNINKLLRETAISLKEGEFLYDENTLTDRPVDFIVQEFIREQLFLNLKEELPYFVTVLVDDFQKREDGLYKIAATIYVAKESQKAIVIGKEAKMLKKIGTLARENIEKYLGSKVFLSLYVKVEKNWNNKEEKLKRFGYFLSKK